MPPCETPVRLLLPPPPLAASSFRQVCPPTKAALRESLALERATALARMPSPELESFGSNVLIAELQARVRELQ